MQLPHNPNDTANLWKEKLNQFVKQNQQSLAAIAWGLHQERQASDNDDILGLDLHPQPRFVNCPRSALEKLNENVDGKIQEVLGIIDNHKPTEEVAILGIGNGQLQLLHFQPQLPPPECYSQATEDLDTLLASLETKLSQSLA